jgi:hypothetical protein
LVSIAMVSSCKNDPLNKIHRVASCALTYMPMRVERNSNVKSDMGVCVCVRACAYLFGGEGGSAPDR